ncbi:ABC transporter permease [Deinococcus humi]|uniref:Peptide/nickel transport system permease protein n=1 Tax=Deinococcus humi TaxID=662880 RepID=A0A7W8K0T5_9DEIO|nr:ABC transporter permease [Deinococcus humi]MBB5365381.1 peptide/nickel transport system permease protein [Deinococcus humi]GGO36124.1 diguanylate cyclase [Deinococcus humi]
MSKAFNLNVSAMRTRRPASRSWRDFTHHRLSVLGLLLLLAFYGAALFAPWVAPDDPYAMNLQSAFLLPGQGGHLLGTDNFGRDLFSRLIYGSRISLVSGLVVVVIAAGLGSLLGLVAGYFRGWVDVLIMRLVEVFFAFPFLVLVVAVIAVLGTSIFNVVWVLGVVSWPIYARLVRAQVLTLRQREFVEAARASGASSGRIMFRYILPNSLTPIIVAATFGVPQAILALAALGFLGLGVQPPTPEWGTMVNEGKNYLLQSPSLIVWPGIFIALVVMSFNFVGDGLRQAFDPRMGR